MNLYSELQKLYDSLYDEKSKTIFLNRLSVNLSNKIEYMVNIFRAGIDSDCPDYTIVDYYDGLKTQSINHSIIVYGASSSGNVRFLFNKNFGYDDILCFCDKDEEKQRVGFNGKKVISPEELLENHKDKKILIESKFFYDEIYKYLLSNGVSPQNIIRHMNYGIQYVDYEYMNFGNDELFIDAGCFDCGTIFDFLKKVNNSFKKIIAFEPDEDNYNKCVEIIREKNLLDRVTIVNGALWKENTILNFSSDSSNGDCSYVSDLETENTVRGFKLDDIVKNERVTFIKMDVEGSELNSLIGAEETIKRFKPKLAICIYHKKEDITEIQRYLLELVPEYRFGIRHYNDIMYETVLYAFIP